jgi:hypothetical protein
MEHVEFIFLTTFRILFFLKIIWLQWILVSTVVIYLNLIIQFSLNNIYVFYIFKCIYICCAIKLECTFNYAAITMQLCADNWCNCLVIVSASDIPTDDRISTKNTSIDSPWWELSTDVLFDHSRLSARARDRKNGNRQ